MKTILIFVLAIFGLLSFTVEASAAPIFVLVHGANFSAKSWQWIQTDLTQQGYQSTAPQLYGPNENIDLAATATRLCAVVADLKTQVILVGHSQGGAIVTQAAAQCPENIKAIIYVAAVVPPPGTGVFDQLSDEDNNYYARCGTLDEKSNTYVLKDQESCRQVFFGDIPAAAAAPYFATMESEPAAIGNSKADYSVDRLKSIPRFYIETLQDLIVGFASQKKIVTQAPMTTILQINSSHTPFFAEHGLLSSMLIGIQKKTFR